MKSQKNEKPGEGLSKQTDGCNNNGKRRVIKFSPNVNKNLCPYYLCQTVGPEKDYPPVTKYETFNVVAENGDSIWSPEYEHSYEELAPQKREEEGQVFINADLVGKIVNSKFSKGAF